MKRFLLIILSVYYITNLFATDSTVVQKSLVSDINKEFYLNEQLQVYKFLPTGIGMWEHGDYSLVSANGNIDYGDFKLIDEFDRNEQFSLKSESVQSLDESGWKFYGNFTLNLSDHENADWNLGYAKSEIGNPFRLITERTGDFNVKHYGLNGIMYKRITDRLALATAVNYRGDLHLRMRDTRNEFYNITTEIIGAVSYSINKHNIVSLGVSYFYKKASPAFTNNFYTTGPDSDKYKLYFNEGLGDFSQIPDLSSEYILKNQNPKYYISYFGGNKNKFSISYAAYLGKELWENKIDKEPVDTLYETHKELYKYEYMSNEILGSYLINNTNYKIFNFLQAKYIDGTGYRYRGFYEKTYIYKGLDVKLVSRVIKPNANLFYSNVLSVDFENKRKKDMLYAQQIDYTNLQVAIKTGYLININSKNDLAIDIEGLYKHNLSYNHEVVSAGASDYTLNLAYNEVAYYSAGFYKLGADIKWLAKIKNSAAEFIFSYRYLKPVNVQFTNQYSVINIDNYRHYLNAGINFYF